MMPIKFHKDEINKTQHQNDLKDILVKFRS